LTALSSRSSGAQRDRRSQKAAWRRQCRDFANGANRAAFRKHYIRDETKTLIRKAGKQDKQSGTNGFLELYAISFPLFLFS
jgi:hypothetical protein